MNEVKNNIRKDFTMTPNALVNDNDISPQARFLFVYMASKPDDWRFYQRALAGDMKWSLDTLRKYQVELLRKGWISREQNRKEKEKFDGFDYVLHASPCTTFSDTVKTRSGKNPQRKNSVLTKKDPEQINTLNSLSPANEIEEIEIPQPTHIWGDNTDTRYQTALRTLESYFEKNTSRRREISDEAHNPCDEKQFDDELTLWLRRYSDDFAITQNPVKALTSGRGCFISWLSQPFCRDKYKTNGNDTSTQRNGRVQQRGAANAFPSHDELKRKYNLL